MLLVSSLAIRKSHQPILVPTIQLMLSIFSTFTLQEVGMLAHRSDPSDSIARTLALTTGLQVKPEDPIAQTTNGMKADERALVM